MTDVCSVGVAKGGAVMAREKPKRNICASQVACDGTEILAPAVACSVCREKIAKRAKEAQRKMKEEANNDGR